MDGLDLFPTEQIVGVFRGFREGGLEFHADLVLPYRNEFQRIPMHGQFLLVQLETPDEAVLGRIASLSSEGKLTTSAGEEFNIRAVREHRAVPEDLREEYLRYRVNMRVLGVLRTTLGEARVQGTTKLTFIPSHRRLPHVGSPIAFAGPEVLREIAGHNVQGAPLGYFALGEYIYAQSAQGFESKPWMRVSAPEVLVRFPIENLVSRRSFVFARAGFGKSNLNKLLFSKLYEDTPTVTKRGGREVPVGTLIFDPDGEYFWPDDKGRPALCDVPTLRDKLVVFTPRQGPSPYYGSFVAGGIKLDIRQLRPGDVVSIALGPDRQDQQNVRKLRGLNQGRWEQLVELIDRQGNQASLDQVADLLHLDKGQQQVEAVAARSNMTTIVRMLHDKSSRLMDMLLSALAEGKLCVIDISQMRSGQALVLSGIILRRIFDHNQQEFTAAAPTTIPTIAVIEEAQAVLDERSSAAEPYITWVKEGRKYDLGAVLVTQQPGSIPKEILSQGDNWFIFHLLSSGDLLSLKQANAHFSDDLLSSLLNEPIAGHGIVWSSASGKPYPTSVRVLSFEEMYQVRDPLYCEPSIETYATKLREDFKREVLIAERAVRFRTPSLTSGEGGNGRGAGSALPATKEIGIGQEASSDTDDPLETFKQNAIDALRSDFDMMTRLRENGVAWGGLKAFLLENLPTTMNDREQVAYRLVSRALNDILGPERSGWHSFHNEDRKTRYVKAGPS